MLIRSFQWFHALAGVGIGLTVSFSAVAAPGIDLPLPPRTAPMESGAEFARRVRNLSLAERDVAIEREILKGNVPDRLRHLQPVPLSVHDGNTNHVVTLFVAPDYLSVGAEADGLWVPMAPSTAQKIADRLDCLLPTPRMVDAIYHSAVLRLPPQPIAASPEMTTVPVFEQHSASIRAQVPTWPGGVVAGHKKDVVICNRLTNAPGKVAIYGWHRTNGEPIQPLYLGHAATWVDYSHGIRLVSNRVLVDGETNSMRDVLNNPVLARGVSDEGVVRLPRYTISPPANSVDDSAGGKQKPESLLPSAVPGETLTYLEVGPNVRALVSRPSIIAAGQPVRLVLYALPNGNTIEQTFGKRTQPDDDWHFDIQHIGAQTRYLRELDSEQAWVVVYLEADGLAWPAWRKRYGDSPSRITNVVERCAERFRDFQAKLVLAGHSGGGSFIFGYLNAIGDIPDALDRIAFLDANYAYDPAQGHGEKLLGWLQSSRTHHLAVFAYNDAVALLDGKPFVSAAGGTWGRSQLMLSNFSARVVFRQDEVEGVKRHRALGGRLQFLLKENPERKILHTVQVERNGFIHAMLSGTSREEDGYRYFGPRAYEKWIR